MNKDGSDKYETVEARRLMLREMGVEGLVVGIPMLSKVLGTPRSSLYYRIGKGTFFLPVRDLHGSPVVMVDDLINWMGGGKETKKVNAVEKKDLNSSSQVVAEKARKSMHELGMLAVERHRERQRSP